MNPSIFLSIYMYLSSYLSMYLCIYLPAYPSIYLFIYLCIYMDRENIDLEHITYKPNIPTCYTLITERCCYSMTQKAPSR